MIVDIIVFVLILLALILVHEWGHFAAARRAGMKVEEFGFGFPPRLLAFKRGGTVFSLNALPIGGFVRIFGENQAENKQPGSFASKSLGARTGVIAAGVVMNFLFAAALFAAGYMTVGLPQEVSDEQAKAAGASIQIMGVQAKSPAEAAGLKPGDIIIGLDEVAPQAIEEIQSYIKSRAGATVHLEVKRGHEIIARDLVPRANPAPTEGPTGILLGYAAIIKYSWYEALWAGIRLAFGILAMIAVWLYELVRGAAPADVAGPVGIAMLTFQLKALGLPYLIRFAGLLSVNLAVINILPLPALDGGRLAFLGLEKLFGRPVSPRLENLVHAVGFALLILFMVLITARDISRL